MALLALWNKCTNGTTIPVGVGKCEAEAVVVLEIFGVYLALAVLFYLRLAAAAADAPIPAPDRRPRWQRARHIKNQAIRRLRPLLALRLPKRMR